MRKIVFLSTMFIMVIIPYITLASDLDSAIQIATVECSGIDIRLENLKKRAGINTAVNAVGTVVGGVALGTGIAKADVDKEQQGLEAKVKQLIAEKSNIKIEKLEIENEQEFQEAVRRIVYDVAYNDPSVFSDFEKIGELEQKSKTLGNIRTGTLAASTVTNVAGTAIAATNKVDEGLEEKINKCIFLSIKDHSDGLFLSFKKKLFLLIGG